MPGKHNKCCCDNCVCEVIPSITQAPDVSTGISQYCTMRLQVTNTCGYDLDTNNFVFKLVDISSSAPGEFTVLSGLASSLPQDVTDNTADAAGTIYELRVYQTAAGPNCNQYIGEANAATAQYTIPALCSCPPCDAVEDFVVSSSLTTASVTVSQFADFTEEILVEPSVNIVGAFDPTLEPIGKWVFEYSGWTALNHTISADLVYVADEECGANPTLNCPRLFMENRVVSLGTVSITGRYEDVTNGTWPACGNSATATLEMAVYSVLGRYSIVSNVPLSDTQPVDACGMPVPVAHGASEQDYALVFVVTRADSSNDTASTAGCPGTNGFTTAREVQWINSLGDTFIIDMADCSVAADLSAQALPVDPAQDYSLGTRCLATWRDQTETLDNFRGLEDGITEGIGASFGPQWLSSGGAFGANTEIFQGLYRHNFQAICPGNDGPLTVDCANGTHLQVWKDQQVAYGWRNTETTYTGGPLAKWSFA